MVKVHLRARIFKLPLSHRPESQHSIKIRDSWPVRLGIAIPSNTVFT